MVSWDKCGTACAATLRDVAKPDSAPVSEKSVRPNDSSVVNP